MVGSSKVYPIDGPAAAERTLDSGPPQGVSPNGSVAPASRQLAGADVNATHRVAPKPSGSAVLHGRFLVDNAQERDFVFIEAGCQLNDGNQIQAILTALGVEEPSLSFCFHPSHTVAPCLEVQDEANQALVQWIVKKRMQHTQSKYRHSEKFEEMLEGANDDVMEAADRLNRPPYAHHEKHLIEEQLQNCIAGISEAGRQLKTIFLLPAPYKGNRLSEIACECLHPGSVALGLFAASDFTLLQKGTPQEEDTFERFTLPSILYTMHNGQWTSNAWAECQRQFKLPMLAFRAKKSFEGRGGIWADLQAKMLDLLKSPVEEAREKRDLRRKPPRSRHRGTSPPSFVPLAEVREVEGTAGNSQNAPSETGERESQINEENIQVDAELTLENALALITHPEFDVRRAEKAVKACLVHEQVKLAIHGHIEEVREELGHLMTIRDEVRSTRQVAKALAKEVRLTPTAKEMNEAERKDAAEDKLENLDQSIEELENTIDNLQAKLAEENHHTSHMPLASRALEKVMSIDAQAMLNEELEVSDHPAHLTQEAAMSSLATCAREDHENPMRPISEDVGTRAGGRNTPLGLDPRRVPAFEHAEPVGQPFKGDKRKRYLHSLRGEVEHAIGCTSSVSTFEAEYARHVRKMKLPGGLISNCTHALVFEDAAMIDQFVRQFYLEFHTGLVVAGGDRHAFDDAVRCIQQGKPTFIFRGTGKAADVLADVVDFYEGHMEAIMHPNRGVGAGESHKKIARKGKNGRKNEGPTRASPSEPRITPAPSSNRMLDGATATTALLARDATRTFVARVGIAAAPSDDEYSVAHDNSALMIMQTVNIDSKKVDAVSLWDHFEELKNRIVQGKKLEEAHSKVQSARLMSEMKRRFSTVKQKEAIERDHKLAIKRAAGDPAAIEEADNTHMHEMEKLSKFEEHVRVLAQKIATVKDHDTPFSLEKFREGANKVKMNSKALKMFLIEMVRLYSSGDDHDAPCRGGNNDKRLAIMQHFVDRTGSMPKLKERAVMLLQNFPETFNKQAVLTINLGVGSLVKVETLQDSITKVMSTVFDEAPELGGKMAEEQAILHVLMLKLQLETSARSYWWEATVLQVIYRILSVATLFLVTMSGLFEDNGMTSSAQYLYYPSIVLPITVALFASVFAMYKPMDRFAAAFLCSKTIESELMRYRTRTGPYRTSTGGSGRKSHRKKFSAKCEELVLNCMMSDMRSGVLARTRTAALRLAQGFSSRSVDETLERERDVEARERTHVIGKLKVVMRAKKREKRMLQDAGITIGVCSADEYIDTRVVRELGLIAKKSPPRYWTHWVLVILALISSALGGILSSARISEWVPMTLAISTMLEYLDKYFMLEPNLASGNMAQASLQTTLLWWDGLSLVERRSREGKDNLVNMCENAIVSRHAAFAAGALAATRSSENENSPEGGGSTDPTTNKGAGA